MIKIKHDYWVVKYKDGDIQVLNADEWGGHQGVAFDQIQYMAMPKLVDCAQELKLDVSNIDISNSTNANKLLNLIFEKLNLNINAADKDLIVEKCRIDKNLLWALVFPDSSINYVIKHEGWIAVRQNNIEISGLNENKNTLVSAIKTVLQQEFPNKDINDEDLEFHVTDIKSGRHMDLTLQDIKEGRFFRPQTAPDTTYNSLAIPAQRGKEFGREKWRGTSESFDFKTFFENNQTVTLYRGDPANYKTHSLSKGDIYALFGQGIYLTNNKRIAGDYTVKGNQDVIFRCSGCKTKQRVIDLFINRQALNFDENGKETYYQTSLPALTDDPIRLKRIEYAKQYWDKIKNNYEVRFSVDGTGAIRKKGVGHVSVYELPIDLVNSVYDTEVEIDDNVLAALCDAMRATKNSCREIYELAQENEDGFKPSFRTIWGGLVDGGWGVVNDQKFQTVFRQSMKGLGYKGLYYYGGMTMGGGIKHKAYVFWDEQGLAKYRKV